MDSDLRKLLRMIREDRGLEWLLIHCTDGDADRSVAACWERETRPFTLILALRKTSRFSRDDLKELWLQAHAEVCGERGRPNSKRARRMAAELAMWIRYKAGEPLRWQELLR